MFDEAAIDGNLLMNIETDFYQSIFDGRLCPSAKDGEGKRKKSYPFQSMWELFVYACVLGFTSERRKAIERPHKPFRWLNIPVQHQKNLLMLAISKHNSLDLLHDKDELKKMIEEYANGGMNLINQEIKNNPSAYSGLEFFTFKVLNES